jgi:hypothetical protein
MASLPCVECLRVNGASFGLVAHRPDFDGHKKIVAVCGAFGVSAIGAFA